MSDLNGLYRGRVQNISDPTGKLRIKALVPNVYGLEESPWAMPCVVNVGTTVLPAVGSPVWIAFEGGSVEKPIWLGTWSL